MVKNMKLHMALSFAIAFFLVSGYANQSQAQIASGIELVVDGKNITDIAFPIIENDRTLVPLRFVSEEIGAQVIWDGEKRSVQINKGEKRILFWIGSHLVDYGDGEPFGIGDVAPISVNDRTYVPLRLLGNALGIGVDWNGDERTVIVDSSKSSTVTPFYDVVVGYGKTYGTIAGKTEIHVSAPENIRRAASEMKLLLLEKDTAKGYVVAKVDPFSDSIEYLPRVGDNGDKVLAVAFYDGDKNFIGGDSISATIDVKPQISIYGVSDSEEIKGTVSIGQYIYFIVEYVSYEIEDAESGTIETLDFKDPFGKYDWTPENGAYSIKAIAYDENGNSYESESVKVYANQEKRLSLTGVSAGMTISQPVRLYASRNFDVIETQYFIRDVETGETSILATIPYGGYTWTPGAGDSGEKELMVSVKDTAGRLHESEFVRVTVDGGPRLMVTGIRPGQVLTESVEISFQSNVDLEKINLLLTEKATGRGSYVAKDYSIDKSFELSLPEIGDGQMSIRAEGFYNGEKVLSEDVTFEIYMGTLYEAKPIVEKDEFLDFASNLASESWQKTGMSAAMQTAQAILETGWGQSVPVDKYSGKFSNNLFGIKGTGSNGSVTSNTWEVYNGVEYRVDDEFRAYFDVQEGWEDHKKFLLERERYRPFTEVMHDSTLGAWAIKRAGYATDPVYATKLINIIKRYGLRRLDQSGI
ncbi:MAG: hypothetical protein C0604_00365 [Clostridiales bacterium]|nr:MAG: hypothetical protein C0604_00365 [Clostridiales bacterium]